MTLALMVAATGHVATKIAISVSTERARLVPNGPRAWNPLKGPKGARRPKGPKSEGSSERLKGGPPVGLCFF